LDEKIAETVEHERVGLSNNGIYDSEFLLGRAHLELLLQENRSLLIVATHDLVDNVLPVTGHAAVQKAAIVKRLNGRNVRLSGWVGLVQ
jgi:hypothetical protein